MPFLVANFDPTSPTSGSVNVGSPNPGAHLEVMNTSRSLLMFDVPNQGTYVILPFVVSMIALEFATEQITWSTLAVLNSNNAPLSQVLVVLYEPNEAVQGSYPMSLPFLSNIGNAVNTILQFPNGIAFPTTPNLYDVFLRSDLGISFWCTQLARTLPSARPNTWESIEVFNVAWTRHDAVQPLTVAGVIASGVLPTIDPSLQLLIKKVRLALYTIAPNTGANYWTAVVTSYSMAGVALNTLMNANTSAAAPNIWSSYETSPNIANTPVDRIQVAATPTGAPGGLYAEANITYALSGTS